MKAKSNHVSSVEDLATIYARVSDDGQSTVPEQIAWAKRTAEANAWTVVGIAKDEGRSGDDAVRPGLDELEALFASHFKAGRPIRRLLVQKTDRLSRSDSLDTFEVLARLRRYGLRYVVTTQRTLDLNDRLDRTLYALEQDHSNNPFLARMAESVLGAMFEVASAGFAVGSVALGYRIVKRPGDHGQGKKRRSGRIEMDPETRPIVDHLFKSYASGASLTDLCAWLEGRVRPPRASAWSPAAVRQMLKRDVYIGMRRYGKEAKGKHVRLSAGGVVPQDQALGQDNLAAAFVAYCPELRIVSDELFARVQQRLATGRRRGYKKDNPPLPLSGLGACAACKGNIGCTQIEGERRRLLCQNRNKYGGRVCQHGSANADYDQVLATIAGLLADTFLRDGALERLVALAELQTREADDKITAGREALLNRIANLGNKLTRAQRRLAEVDTDMIDHLQAGIRQLQTEQEQAQAELRRLEVGPKKALAADPAKLQDYWQTCRAAVDLLQQVRQQEALPPSLAALMAELIVGFTVHWKKDGRGRSVPAQIDIKLPAWVTLLLTPVSQNSQQCDPVPLILSAAV